MTHRRLPPHYVTLRSSQRDEFTTKRSRFIGFGAPAEDEDEVHALLADRRERHPQATHHCYAYRVGLRTETIRFHDDGEPTGTAGRPILNVMQRGEVQNALIVVTRYYGGTPLGAAGLTRAYAHGAQLALAAAQTVRLGLHIALQCQVDYEAFGKLQHVLLERGVPPENIQYGADVRMQLWTPLERQEEITNVLRELTGGQASVLPGQTAYRPLGDEDAAAVDTKGDGG